MPGDLENISKKMRELVDGMKSSFQKASANISGHIGDVMSDELKMTTDTIKSVGESAKDVTMKILKFFGTGWTLELKSFAVDKKQLDVLEDIRDQAKEEKLSRLSQFKKTKGAKLLAALLDLLGVPLAILAAGIGAIIGQILIPFKGIYKILKPFFKLFGSLTKIGKLFTKIAAIGKISKMINAFKWLGKLFGFILKLPGLRIIVAGLRFGFTKLLWPLQILLSLFDFIEGFMEKEGSIWDKIKAGISNAVMKFIKFPAKLIGKAIDFLLGREKGTTEGEIMTGVEKYLNLFFNLYEKIFNGIKVALEFVVDVLKKVSWEKTIEVIDNIRTWIEELPDKIFNWLSELMEKAKFWKQKWFFGGLKEDKNDIIPGKGTEDIWQPKVNEKLENQNDQIIQLQKENNEIQKKLLDKPAAIVPMPVNQPSAPAIPAPKDERPLNLTAEEIGSL